MFHAKEPAPVGFYYEIDLRAYDLMWRCLAQHMPERLAAGHFASVCGTFIGGIHPDTGRQYTIIEPQLGGWGGREGMDGNNAMFCGFHGETFNCPAEVNEARNGLYVDQMTLNMEPAARARSPVGAASSWTTACRADDGFLTMGYTRSKFPPGPWTADAKAPQLRRVHSEGREGQRFAFRLRPQDAEGRRDPRGDRKRRRIRRSEQARPRSGAP